MMKSRKTACCHGVIALIDITVCLICSDTEQLLRLVL